eukprot:Sdes_comp21808_c0_seq1m20371
MSPKKVSQETEIGKSIVGLDFDSSDSQNFIQIPFSFDLSQVTCSTLVCGPKIFGHLCRIIIYRSCRFYIRAQISMVENSELNCITATKDSEILIIPCLRNHPSVDTSHRGFLDTTISSSVELFREQYIEMCMKIDGGYYLAGS